MESNDRDRNKESLRVLQDMTYAPINGMPHYPPPGVIGGR